MRSSRCYLRRASLLLMAAAFTACGGSEPKVPTTLTLDAGTVSFTAIGQTRKLAASVTDQDGGSIASPAITWTSSNTAVAAVDAAGVVSAVGNGSATITAAAGAATESADVTVAQVPTQIVKVSGDGQTAVVGQALPLPLSVRVADANGAGVAGATVTFAADAGSGTLGTPSMTTGSDGVASTSFTIVALGSVQVPVSVSTTTITTSFAATGTSPFVVDLRFLTTPTAAQRQAFTAARDRWQGLITSELPDGLLNAPVGTCGSESPAINRTVDDVLILVNLTTIDGPGGVLGAAGPCYVRNVGSLTVMGLMRFDTDDLDQLESAGLLRAVILHEMGHVLGFGTLWPDLGLLAGPALLGGNDPHFTGTLARAEFDANGGLGYSGGLKVPVEDTGGAGTADSHWRESVFGRELMTGFVDAGVNPLSSISVASLADLGYTVNLAAADAYTLSPGLRAFGARPTLDLGNDVLAIPRRVVDGAGQVVRIIAP
jgi:hypothetical protein